MIHIKTWLVFGAVFASVMLFVFALTWNQIRDAYARASPCARGVFFVAVAGITLYGGSKGIIHFPFTDPEVRYLTDTGSAVSNDFVHVSFNRSVLVPNTASFYIDGCDVLYTNAEDVAAYAFNAYSNTFDRMTVPFDMPYQAATNFNWYAYTDWTPPIAVHTNGVAFVVWQIGSTTNNLSLTRTGVYTNSVRLAPNPAITNFTNTTTN